VKAASEVIKDILVAAGQATFADTTADWPLFISTEPEDPDQVITLYDGDPLRGSSLKHDEAAWQQIQVQIRLRNRDYQAGYTKMADLLKTIAQKGLFREDADESGENDIRWHSFRVVNGPLHIGKDDNKRHLFTANVRASKEEIA